MKFHSKFFVSILLVLTIFSFWTSPAYSADPPCAITSITPNFFRNDQAQEITVTGTAFSVGAKISLQGISGFFSAGVNGDFTQLVAVIPPGVPAGTYNLLVLAADSSVTCSSPSGLTIADPSPLPTATPPPFTRPQMVVDSSGANVEKISSGKNFKFTVNFDNAGKMMAYNVQAVFSSADLVPLDTGGVAAIGNIPAGGGASVDQRFTSDTSALYGKTFVVIDVTLTYYDDKGTSYSDKFTLNVPAAGGSGGTGVYATATPTGVRSGQLIIPSYGTTVDPLQPGTQFTLTMTVQNAGNDKAQRVTMIVGGGSSGSDSGTPQPGGVSGGSGEFTNFAPVGTSNIKSLGDIASGSMMQVSQDLIVNVSTDPGAYPMKITFSYLNARGEVVNDEQVITLLVYRLPNIEISFYRPLDLFFNGQPGALPIQVVNLGKHTAVMGNMSVTSEKGLIENGSSLVGSLDAGGYFTMDAMFFPDTSGTITLNVLIEYTDDFNQPRTIEKTLEINVEEEFMEPTPDPSIGGGGVEETFPSEESFLQKTWRFILGLLGLDSSAPASSPDLQVPPVEEMPIPNQGGGGKGG